MGTVEQCHAMVFNLKRRPITIAGFQCHAIQNTVY